MVRAEFDGVILEEELGIYFKADLDREFEKIHCTCGVWRPSSGIVLLRGLRRDWKDFPAPRSLPKHCFGLASRMEHNLSRAL